ALPAVACTVAALGVLAVLGVLLVDVRPMPSPGGQAAAVGIPAGGPRIETPSVPVGPVAASIAVPTVRGLVPVGATPGDIAVAPDGRTAIIAHRAAGFVSVLDTAIDKVTATIAVPAGPPRFVTFSPDSSRAYVTVFDDARTVSLVAVLDTADGALLTTIPVGQRPFAPAVTPDGSRLWVPSHDDARIDVIDTATDAVTTSIPVPASPHGVAFSADGTRAYVANHESNVVSVLDTASATPVATIPVGTSPQATAVGGGQTAVANYDGGSVTIIDAAGAPVAEVPVGRTPQDVGFAPDGRYLYTADVEADTVSVVDMATRAVTATIPVCDGPTSVAAHPSGRVAYVTCVNSGEVMVLDTTADQ
ncbi:beta-propeller fold lactonase family protein, partial [Pseudonocardia lacus]|uniref:beta-propeller fold lactonase family protein n=1 Tax=Pseudonocardia lacus TaxID=2835865 RepID=UPI001BDCC6FC